MRNSTLLIVSAVIVTYAIASTVTAAQANPRVTELQQALNQLGYDAGSEDGVLGPATREAFRAFQQDHDMEVDGQYSGLLLFKVKTELSLARKRATPEGQAREREKNRLISLSNEELINEIRGSNKEDAERKLYLIGERARDLPARLIYDAIGITEFDALQMVMQVALRGLYYPGSEEGVKQFQNDIDADPTGELTLGQVEELQRRFMRTRDTKVYASGLGDALTISRFQGYLQVEGTWILEDDNIAYPINTSKITCDRTRRECEVIQADVVVPAIDDSDDSYMVNVDSNTYSVVSWDAGEVVARDSGTCRTSILTINSNSAEVFAVTRNNETKECREGYLTLPGLEKPRIARLVPGLNRTYKWWQDRQKRVSEYINPRYRKQMEEAVKAEPRP